MPYTDPERKRLHSKIYYEKHREKIKARANAWQKENAEHRKKYLEQYRANNKEKCEALKRAWYERNREKFQEQSRANYERRRRENPEHVLAQQRNTVARRRARQREAFIENVDPRVVWKRDKGICQLCGELADVNDWHLDHIRPIAKGGEHSYANVQVAHPLCNWRKAASWP